MSVEEGGVPSFRQLPHCNCQVCHLQTFPALARTCNYGAPRPVRARAKSTRRHLRHTPAPFESHSHFHKPTKPTVVGQGRGAGSSQLEASVFIISFTISE